MIQNDIINSIAKEYGLPQNDLFIKTIIDLKRFNRTDTDNNFVESRARLVAKDILKKRIILLPKYDYPVIKKLESKNYELRLVGWRVAKQILENFHYIGSYRKKSIQLGLYYKIPNGGSKLAGLMTFSNYDLHVRPDDIFYYFHQHELLNLARLYTFQWVPYNTTSFFMSLAFDYIRKNYPEIRCLTTCANLNVGHTGSSYKASNWIEIAQFIGAPYLFLDDKNVTMRSLVEICRTLDMELIKKKLKGRLVVSSEKVLPQKIFIYILNKSDKRKFIARRASHSIYFEKWNFIPEYGLTDYCQNKAINFEEAKRKINNIGRNVVAGYVERDGEQFYSAIAVKIGDSYFNIRKSKRWREEFVNDSNELPFVAELPDWGKTLILICYDVKRFSEIDMRKEIGDRSIDTLFVLSYWKNNFDILLDCVKRVEQSLKIKKIICSDYFHGFQVIKY